jgi:hypothetical protein
MMLDLGRETMKHVKETGDMRSERLLNELLTELGGQGKSKPITLLKRPPVISVHIPS